MNDELQISTHGRSVGEVEEPEIEAQVPKLSDSELEAVASQVGLNHLKFGRIKALRDLGHVAKEEGVVSLGRGMMLASFDQMYDISQRARQLEEAADEHDHKAAYLRVRTACAVGMATVAKNAMDTIAQRKQIPEPPPLMPSLPRFGENVTVTSVQAETVHLHTDHGKSVLHQTRDGATLPG